MIAKLLFMVLLVIWERMKDGIECCFLLLQSVFKVIHQEFGKTVVRVSWKALALFDSASQTVNKSCYYVMA